MGNFHPEDGGVNPSDAMMQSVRDLIDCAVQAVCKIFKKKTDLAHFERFHYFIFLGICRWLGIAEYLGTSGRMLHSLSRKCRLLLHPIMG